MAYFPRWRIFPDGVFFFDGRFFFDGGFFRGGVFPLHGVFLLSEDPLNDVDSAADPLVGVDLLPI